ncbi:hypothetical protein NPIL_7391 [Nephila pilipes]|uniref:Endonuclease/exonuclease/phosphatase domain-containing protein n=1 Tax=Nephila pilipes TaxID=299642 RepID=A0A8X6TXN3_NEPPI|nr:hypothetical protein NPIL_7391 [Nephila pilipes]
MNKSPEDFHDASLVAQSKKDLIPGLGRGPCPKNKLQSPKALKILQLNINGISTNGAIIKLDQILDLAETHRVQIIALQEIELKTSTSLKIKGYNIFRADRQNNNGGGLVFLIRSISYKSVNISTSILDNNNLEVQGIRVTWREKPLNIFNLYKPSGFKGLPNELQELLIAGTICIGDLKAKHSVWGSTSTNSRAQDDGQAANMLGKHYQNVSRLYFTHKDRDVTISASYIVHGYHSSSQDETSIFNKDFTTQELETAISETNLNKSPGPDGSHGQMIGNLGQRGNRLIEIINESWRIGQLPSDWRRAIVIPIRNPSKEANSPKF